MLLYPHLRVPPSVAEPRRGASLLWLPVLAGGGAAVEAGRDHRVTEAERRALEQLNVIFLGKQGVLQKKIIPGRHVWPPGAGRACSLSIWRVLPRERPGGIRRRLCSGNLGSFSGKFYTFLYFWWIPYLQGGHVHSPRRLEDVLVAPVWVLALDPLIQIQI